MMMIDDLERALRDAGRVEPGAEVRARVLAAAMPLVRADDSRLDRLWFSVRWRAAVALALLVIAGVDRMTPRVAWTPVAQDHLAANSAKAVVVAAREVGLTPEDTAVLVAQAIEAEGARR